MLQKGLEGYIVLFMSPHFVMNLLKSQTEINQVLPWNVTQAVLMALAVFQPHHPVVQCSITHGQNCNSPSASSGLVRSMTPGPIFPSSLGFPVNCGPKFSNLVLSWKRTEGLLMLHIG